MTYRDFKVFVQEVQALWFQGQLGPSDQLPKDDEHCGPNLYFVNEHYVKPITLEAGGMSYVPGRQLDREIQ